MEDNIKMQPYIPPYLESITTDLDDLEDEMTVQGKHLKNLYIEDQTCRNLLFKECILENVTFSENRFKKIEFNNVIFKKCDLSNQNMEDAIFHKSRFEECKLTGLSLPESCCLLYTSPSPRDTR